MELFLQPPGKTSAMHWTLVIFRSKFTGLEKEFPSPQHNPGASCYLLFLQLVRGSCSFSESLASVGRESLPLGLGNSPAVSCKSLPDPSSLLASSPVPLPPGTPLSEQSGGRDFSRFGGKWIWQRSAETRQLFTHPLFLIYSHLPKTNTLMKDQGLGAV